MSSKQLHEYAQRLMTIHTQETPKSSASAIFGSGSELVASLSHQHPYRIGLWPCINAHNPKLAMGIWSVFAYLLEQYSNIIVYRNFVNFSALEDENAQDDSPDLSGLNTQFSVDDWIFEELGENVAIWGHLSILESNYQLDIFIESDLHEEQDNSDVKSDTENISKVTILASNLSQLIDAINSNLEKIFGNIVTTDDILKMKPLLPSYPHGSTISSQFLESLFDWEIYTLHYLWSLELDDDLALEKFQKLHDHSPKASSIEAWFLGALIYQSTLPKLSLIGELLIDEANLSASGESIPFTIFLVRALHQVGRAQVAQRILDQLLDETPDIVQDVVYWLNICDALLRAGDLIGAIDSFQLAIENDAVSSILFKQYASALELADRYGVDITTFILVDPDIILTDRLIWEAVYALGEIENSKHSNLDVLVTKLGFLVTLDIPTFWDEFATLVKLDVEHHYIPLIIELLENSDYVDLTPGIAILEKSISDESDSVKKGVLHLDIAHLLVIDNQIEIAKQTLIHAQKLVRNFYHEEVEYLSLMIGIDNYAFHIADIRTVLQAGNRISDVQSELLKKAINLAPNNVELYILYAQNLRNDDQSDQALNTLLDAHERIGEDSALITAIVECLREFDDDRLTEEYILKGFENSPGHLPLMIQATYFYIDTGKLIYARELLAQIENITPNDPQLDSLRRYVAQNLG